MAILHRFGPGAWWRHGRGSAVVDAAAGESEDDLLLYHRHVGWHSSSPVYLLVQKTGCDEPAGAVEGACYQPHERGWTEAGGAMEQVQDGAREREVQSVPYAHPRYDLILVASWDQGIRRWK